MAPSQASQVWVTRRGIYTLIGIDRGRESIRFLVTFTTINVAVMSPHPKASGPSRVLSLQYNFAKFRNGYTIGVSKPLLSNQCTLHVNSQGRRTFISHNKRMPSIPEEGVLRSSRYFGIHPDNLFIWLKDASHKRQHVLAHYSSHKANRIPNINPYVSDSTLWIFRIPENHECSTVPHRAPPQVADRGTPTRYGGYRGNKIPGRCV